LRKRKGMGMNRTAIAPRIVPAIRGLRAVYIWMNREKWGQPSFTDYSHIEFTSHPAELVNGSSTHLSSEEREAEAKERPDDGRSGQCRACLHKIYIDDVVEKGEEDHDKADAKGKSGEARGDPMDRLVGQALGK
jgi:hypothetical protein